MYDRQTQSWWQQFTGKAIVGKLVGKTLTKLPSRTMPFGQVKAQYPQAQILQPSNSKARPYGKNPYRGYDQSSQPFLYRGDYNGPGSPLSYVVAVANNAWLLSQLRQHQSIQYQDLIITWQTGMNSALDKAQIQHGRDIGYVRVQRQLADGKRIDKEYTVTFAFAFKAFQPNGIIHH